MDREEARRLMESKLANANLRKHVLAVAAVMRGLARRFGQDADKWELVGLLHDLDYEVTVKDPDRHGLVSAEWLEGRVDAEVIEAVKAHADKAPRDKLMNQAVYCADPVTGFVVACALIHPEKKLAPIDVPFALKRIKEKRFAAGASRERIAACAELGLSMEEFMGIAIGAMKGISSELGL
ncbi:MAG TPA: HD domain-containing protein [bacterium]|nr:HD domain-containing protein [bacterium]